MHLVAGSLPCRASISPGAQDRVPCPGPPTILWAQECVTIKGDASAVAFSAAWPFSLLSASERSAFCALVGSLGFGQSHDTLSAPNSKDYPFRANPIAPGHPDHRHRGIVSPGAAAATDIGDEASGRSTPARSAGEWRAILAHDF